MSDAQRAKLLVAAAEGERLNLRVASVVRLGAAGALWLIAAFFSFVSLYG